ncbi:MAG TPA: hypothetical protein VJS20_06755, partial [Gemmatimonadales bacterium]|nr:hypothetical protein [Gemmatimonadales bacterium]
PGPSPERGDSAERHTANYSGGTPRMAAMDDPWKVVDAIVRAALDPREEAAVGWKAKLSNLSYRLFPDLTERIAAGLVRRYQVEAAAPAPPTSGTFFEPMPSGDQVEGGARERMKHEDAARQGR